MEESHAARETRLRELASRLLFTLSKEGARFSLFRDTDVSQPVTLATPAPRSSPARASSRSVV